MPNTMRGYKAFDKDFRCRGYQYRVGETARCERATVCREGFHFCPRALDCLRYYDLATSRFAEVEAHDATVEGCKAVTTDLHIVREIPREEFAAMCTGTLTYTHFLYHNEYTVVNGKLHGLYRVRLLDVNPLVLEGTYVEGQRHGPVREWHESGIYREFAYHKDRIHGAYKTWGANGALIGTHMYRYGQRVG